MGSILLKIGRIVNKTRSIKTILVAGHMSNSEALMRCLEHPIDKDDILIIARDTEPTDLLEQVRRELMANEPPFLITSSPIELLPDISLHEPRPSNFIPDGNAYKGYKHKRNQVPRNHKQNTRRTGNR